MATKGSKAIYLQLADKIMDSILAGSFAAEERIPSVREYAATVEVNANTVMRTYDTLQQLGIITNRRGIGFFVAADAVKTILETRRQQFFNDETAYFFERLRQFGVTPDELKTMFTNYLNNTK